MKDALIKTNTQAITSEVSRSIKQDFLPKFNPEIVNIESLHLTHTTPDALKTICPIGQQDINFVHNISLKRSDLELMYSVETPNSYYIKSAGDQDSSILYILDPHSTISEDDLHVNCNDILIGGSDGKYISISSLFPEHTKKLSIATTFLESNPAHLEHKQLKSTAFEHCITVDDIENKLEMREPRVGLSLALLGHESGHMWIRHLGLIDRNYHSIDQIDNKVLEKANNSDAELFENMVKQLYDERLASYISRQILWKLKNIGFLRSNTHLADQYGELEKALETYDSFLSPLLYIYSTNMNIDLKEYMASRSNRTDEGSKQIINSLVLSDTTSKEVSNSALKLITGVDDNVFFADDYVQYRSDDGILVVRYYTSSDNLVTKCEVESNIEGQKTTFSTSPLDGVSVQTSELFIHSTPGIYDKNFSKNTEALMSAKSNAMGALEKELKKHNI